MSPDQHRELVVLGWFASLADGHDADASPIGVLAGHRRLDQR